MNLLNGLLNPGSRYPTPIPMSPFTGNVFYVDPKNGSDGQVGTLQAPFQTLGQAFNACVAGHNDLIVLISDGTTASSARLTAGFNWNKAATHLIGVCSGSRNSNRARIAPLGGTTAFANFFTVSVDGCYFEGIEFYQGFAAGVAASICMTLSGGRNHFKDCQFAGMNDATSAGSTTSRNLLITGTGENFFEDCVIGDDTTSRGVANSNLELAGGTPRNRFRDCSFPMYATNAGVLGILAAAAASIDRETLFERCSFLNAVGSAATALTGLAKVAAASGGLLAFKDCFGVGIGDWGADAGSKAQIYIDMAAPNGAGGIAINAT